MGERAVPRRGSVSAAAQVDFAPVSGRVRRPGLVTAQLFRLPIALLSVVEAEAVRYPLNHGMPSHDRQPRVEARCATAIE
ncbi:hypothetical protein [Hymenobacter terricola]|uniref:hypothetical protein n=1 Tax=Hymenobacter terricola TaxID=2819236 RepID=UPI001CF18BBA|nr:hypothetical protein [Hymenobacter terricola]